MTFIKICGLQPGDDLSFTSDSAVQYIGIVFAQKSKRYVNPSAAREITTGVDPSCRTMGVFVDMDLQEMLATGQESGINGMQLHGRESVAVCDQLREEGFLVWKALSMRKENAIDKLTEQLESYANHVDGLLLDAPPPIDEGNGVTGGFGVQFDWNQLPQLLSPLVKREGFPPVWIAGGIQPDNVATLGEIWQPYGIDVSSGVEENGRKSPRRIRELIEVVKSFG